MMKICSTINAAVIIFALFSWSGTIAHAQENDKKEKSLRIKWATIEGIVKFNVQIKDEADTLLVDRTVETSFIDFLLPPGKYRIRIGAINKFQKISFWTEWDVFEIRKSVKSRFFTNDYAAGVGLKIRAGASYNMLLPPWSTQYKNTSFDLTHLNYMGSIGFHFGNSRYISPKNFLRFMGIELEGSYCNYAGNNSIDFRSKLTNILAGPALFIKTQLNIPLNFYFRFGGGVSYSKQEYTKLKFKLPIDGQILTLDPYARAGVAIELNFLFALSLDIGVDYYIIFYRDQFFQSLRYYAMLGVRI